MRKQIPKFLELTEAKLTNYHSFITFILQKEYLLSLKHLYFEINCQKNHLFHLITDLGYERDMEIECFIGFNVIIITQCQIVIIVQYLSMPALAQGFIAKYPVLFKRQ